MIRTSMLFSCLVAVACVSSKDEATGASTPFPPSDSVTTGPAWDPQGPYGAQAHLALIKQGLTALYTSEENNHGVNGRYTALIDSIGKDRLGVLLPPGVAVRVTFASDSGFAAIGIHSAGPRSCVVWGGIVPDSMRPATSRGARASAEGQLACDR